jgi:hypothetical protein
MDNFDVKVFQIWKQNSEVEIMPSIERFYLVRCSIHGEYGIYTNLAYEVQNCTVCEIFHKEGISEIKEIGECQYDQWCIENGFQKRIYIDLGRNRVGIAKQNL